MQPWDRCARLGCGHARHGVRRGEGHFCDGAGACKEPRCTCEAFVEEPRWRVLQRIAGEERARARRQRRRALPGHGRVEEAGEGEEGDREAGAAQATPASSACARAPWRPAA